MKTKSLMTAALFMAASFFAAAQTANVKATESITKDKNPNYGEARSLINAAMQNPETKDDAKTWFVAASLENKQFTNENMKQTIGQEPDKASMNEALLRILPYLVKANELDNAPNAKGKVKPRFEKKIPEILKTNHLYYINAGGYYMEQKDYKKALEAFDQFLAIKELPMFASDPSISAKDSNSMMVGFFSAACAYQTGDRAKTLEIAQRIKNDPYRVDDVYQLIATVYNEQKDTLNYIKTLEEGIKLFPKQPYYLLNLINNYIGVGRTDDAINMLNIAITEEPNNLQYYNVMAKLYENSNKLDKAEEWLLKAMVISTEDAAINYDLGRLYYNRAAELKSADKITAQIEAQAKEYMNKALPLLEKAYKINPEESWYVLRNVYYNLKMNDKYEELTKKHGN